VSPVGVAGLTGRLKSLLVLCKVESVTFAWKEKSPCRLVVPEIVPVAEFNIRPCGSEPEEALQEYGPLPPLTVSVAEYGTPAVACGRLVEVMRILSCERSPRSVSLPFRNNEFGFGPVI
jgi:hypothetical protein